VELTIMAGLHTTWERWLSAHPDTLVLDKKGGYRSDGYSSYYTDGRTGILGQRENDPRLFAKDLVVGVIINGQAKTYPI
jgi:hypothetical protein